MHCSSAYYVYCMHLLHITYDTGGFPNRQLSENSGKFWNFRKIWEFPENPGISENPGENFRNFGENFFREFSKLQKVRATFRKISLFL